MTVYAVGDVQGYHEPLLQLLAQVGFAPERDQLWSVGDLVNRGPHSLEVLRFVRGLGSAAKLVLGNHEIHLLAVAEGVRRLQPQDTLQPILDAPDRAELIAWLRQQPLLHVDAELGYCMAHAGIPPHWDLNTACALADEARDWMLGEGLSQLISSELPEPTELSPALNPAQRARAIVSYFTRMRVCTASGRLHLGFKGKPAQAPAGYLPWFAHPERKTREQRVIFGHWAALEGHADAPNVFALDTGCAWGRSLTLLRLSDGLRFDCRCVNPHRANES
jgi:bis(5'-nucleosyl)-tetraphosphatase (symmetrical)